MATLILICGLPGAGKTTLARQLEASRNAFRFCPDAWVKAILEDESDIEERDRLRDPVEAIQWQAALKLLTLGVTVILENGFWTREERDGLRTQAKTQGAQVELHYLDVPKEVLWRRIEARNAHLTESELRMTREELDAAWPWYQVPDADELQKYDAHQAW